MAAISIRFNDCFLSFEKRREIEDRSLDVLCMKVYSPLLSCPVAHSRAVPMYCLQYAIQSSFELAVFATGFALGRAYAYALCI